MPTLLLPDRHHPRARTRRSHVYRRSQDVCGRRHLVLSDCVVLLYEFGVGHVDASHAEAEGQEEDDQADERGQADEDRDFEGSGLVVWGFYGQLDLVVAETEDVGVVFLFGRYLHVADYCDEDCLR